MDVSYHYGQTLVVEDHAQSGQRSLLGRMYSALSLGFFESLKQTQREQPGVLAYEPA
jgi:hypothetical protein